jgi:hypothetical protein
MTSRSRGSKQLPPGQRGLDHAHRTNRERLIHRHIDGTPCWWCGRPMYREAVKNWDAQALAADHSKSRARHGIGKTHADRLLHGICNKQRGDGSRDHLRPALLAQAANQATTATLGHLAIAWPMTWKINAATTTGEP